MTTKRKIHLRNEHVATMSACGRGGWASVPALTDVPDLVTCEQCRRTVARRHLVMLHELLRDEMDYWAIADELNGDVDNGLSLSFPDDFDTDALENGARHAKANDLPWPPPPGFLDEAYIRKIGPFAPKPSPDDEL